MNNPKTLAQVSQIAGVIFLLCVLFFLASLVLASDGGDSTYGAARTAGQNPILNSPATASTGLAPALGLGSAALAGLALAIAAVARVRKARLERAAEGPTHPETPDSPEEEQ